MDLTPPPIKPPRAVKYGKDELGCGFLVNVIKSLGFSETNAERQSEQFKIENEFKKSDLRLSILVSNHDKNLTRVLPYFSLVSNEVATSREKITLVKEKLKACKHLLQCRRGELKKLWTDAVQHKYILEIMEQINVLRKVPQEVVTLSSKRHYLHASKKLTDAIELANVPMKRVEGLVDLRSDLGSRKMQLYNKMYNDLLKQLYCNSAEQVLEGFLKQSSYRSSNCARRSTDRIQANETIKRALVEMAHGFGTETLYAIEDDQLKDSTLSATYFISTIVESFGMLEKVPESQESLKIQILSQLLLVVRNTTNQMKSLKIAPNDKHPLLLLLQIIFNQFKAIAKTHTLLLKNYLNVIQKYSIDSVSPYSLQDFWAQAQYVLQLLLTDYLDIQNIGTGDISHSNFNEPTNDINTYLLRRKLSSNKRCLMFKFNKSSHIQSKLPGLGAFSDDYATNVPVDLNEKKRDKVLICSPDQKIITKIYLPLMGYIQEIENFMNCKPGHPCSLHDFIRKYVKETFLTKGHNKNLQLTIDYIAKNQDMWRTTITTEEMKSMNLSRPLLKSTILVETCLIQTKRLIQDLPDYSDDLLKTACALLKRYREICQTAYKDIMQPDGKDKRICSVIWLKDEDINRFLKTLPNWTALKSSSLQQGKSNKKLQRNNYQPSEEEGPLQVQTRNIREAEMLTSNLGETGISQQEILSDINALKDLAILQESMEWFSSRVAEFANDLRRPVFTGEDGECLTLTVTDGTIKVLTNLALEFDELANTCLLVLHLEIRVQCFYYLQINSESKVDSFIAFKNDTLEPDRQVLKLTKLLSEMDEAFNATLHPRKIKYIFEGLAHLASRILIQASNYLDNIDEISVHRMCRNSIALQQTLSSITATREVALDQAKNFYELLRMDPEEILMNLIEKGPQFTEMQYLVALQLSCKCRGITNTNTLAVYQQKLSDIMGSKAPVGIVV